MERVSEGPNKGLWYLTDIPLAIAAHITINRTALSKGSDFWKLQPVRAAPGQCTRSDVVPFIPVILRHEGIPPNDSSHAGLFLRELESDLGQSVESTVRSSSFELVGAVDSITDAPVDSAVTEQKLADSQFPPRYCGFRYFSAGGSNP